MTLLAILALGGPSAAHAEDSASQHAENLAALRTDVETLSGEVELQKDDLRGRLRALETQKADLQAQIRREEIRVAQLDRAVAELKDATARAEADGAFLTPVLLRGVEQLRVSIETGLPFHAVERLEELAKLEEQMRAGTLRPQRATSRLWQFVEDELRLTRENAIDHQIVTFEDEDVLVDVIRLGMVALYFRTEDGRAGRAVRDGDDWRFEVYDTRADIERVASLADAIEKQIRVGWFEVPDALMDEVKP